MTGKINATDLKCVDESCNDFTMSLRESIKSIIKEEGYLKHKVETKLVPQAGNFLSFLYEVDITGETADGEKVTSLFIKKSVTLDKITLANVSDAYSRELFIYNDISRIFLRIQEAAKVPDKERFRFLKSYVSDNEAIIMENLSKKGFKSYNGKEVVTLKFAELSLIELAKFHAFSYVLKKKLHKYFDTKIKIIKHPFHLDSDWDGFINNICMITSQVLKGEASNKLKNYAPRMLQTYQKYTKDIIPSNGCLCHGDYKILNILARDVGGELLEIQPIDYQLVYYGNPLDDFLFFIFTGTDREFRRKHLSYLKDLYFDSFAKFLSYFNVDVNSTYSRREFEADYEERLELGLVFGLYLSVFTFANIEDGFDVSKLSLSELPIVPDDMFTNRVRGIVQDYIDWGYL